MSGPAGSTDATGSPSPGADPGQEADADPYRPEWALDSDLPELLRVFNRAGVLAPADVHASVRLSRLAGESDPEVMLAVALAVRGPRVGHVAVDLRGVRRSAVVGEDDVDLEGLPWPEPGAWVERVAASPLVGPPPAHRPGAAPAVPLRLFGSLLYLDRYLSDEMALAADLIGRAASPIEGLEPDRTGPVDPSRSGAADLDRLFPGPGSADQRHAAAAALGRRLTVLAGGPGTGKTTTVARLLALLCEQALRSGRRPPLIALAAPTGKAAARMEEAVRLEAGRLDTSPRTQEVLAGLSGMTIHRLLGTRPDRSGRFRHHRAHLLPHEVVVVDEASMVSLSLMTRLVEAVRPDARLVLVGDPEQLVSVEAGAVLAEIVGPVAAATSPVRPPNPAVAGSISLLRTNHRFSGSLARLAEAVRTGDVAATLEVLGAGQPGVEWHDADPASLLAAGGGAWPGSGPLAGVAEVVTSWARAVHRAAVAGDAVGALESLRTHRLLCAHRRGPSGVAVWNQVIEAWLATSAAGLEGEWLWYAGRPVLVTANDYPQRLYNGDAGVAVTVHDEGDSRGAAHSASGASLRVVFDQGPGRPRMVSPSRLGAVETVYAMTVHKSQGSEFDRVTLLMPPASSRLLTRELLYTALTRARHSILVVGTGAAVAGAVERPVSRASGLGHRLWDAAPSAGI